MDLQTLKVFINVFASNAFYAFLIPVIGASILYYLLGVYYLLIGRKEKNETKGENCEEYNLPFVTIQIPVYNDNIVSRCIKHCVNFDYPKDKYEIQIVDDSDDETTIKIVDETIENYKNLLKIYVVRRNNRKGFKPGALNNAIKYAKGEIFVIFDSDFAPEKDFLRRLITPLINDNDVDVVQSRMGFLNANKNFITRFAAGLLMVYNGIILKLTSKKGITFLQGTGLAIKKETLLACGKWNEKSVTEDADLTLTLLEKNYKIKFLENLINPGEVPFTLRSFLRQQMRWSYGMIRAGIEHKRAIFSNKFSVTQKILINLILFTSIFSFLVVGMTLFAILATITGAPAQIGIGDILRFLTVLILTFGFAFTMLVVSRGEIPLRSLPSLILTIFFLGVILSIAISVAAIRASKNKEMWWHKTQKSEE